MVHVTCPPDGRRDTCTHYSSMAMRATEDSNKSSSSLSSRRPAFDATHPALLPAPLSTLCECMAADTGIGASGETSKEVRSARLKMVCAPVGPPAPDAIKLASMSLTEKERGCVGARMSTHPAAESRLPSVCRSDALAPSEVAKLVSGEPKAGAAPKVGVSTAAA